MKNDIFLFIPKILHEIRYFLSFTSFYHNLFLCHRKHLSSPATVYSTLHKNNNEIFKINKLLFSTPYSISTLLLWLLFYAHIARVSNHHEKNYKTDWTYLFISYFNLASNFDEKICFMSHIWRSYTNVLLWSPCQFSNDLRYSYRSTRTIAVAGWYGNEIIHLRDAN